ncbi:MAG: hypothetical protein JWQ71_4709 [Pedosphaera sp.]|nr:hypothetical protein [Pedosphaera sp.]
MSAEFGPEGKAIIEYLKASPNVFVSGREIARKAGGKKKYTEDRFWAVPFLRRLTKEYLIEADSAGSYRIMPEDHGSKKLKLKRHVSPQILKILKSSGKSFEGVAIEIDTENYEPPIAPFPGPRFPSSNRPGNSSDKS